GGGGKVAVFSPPVSLSVQRSTLPVSTSSEYTSDGERAETSTKPRSLLLLCHLRPEMEPAGNFDGNGFSLPVAVSSRCNVLTPSSLATKAMILPSGDNLNTSISHL